MSDSVGICCLILIYVVFCIVPLIYDSDTKLGKKVRRKLHSIIKSRRKRKKEFEETLYLNHIEYRLQSEYNVRTLYELYRESDTDANFDVYQILLIDCDTNKMVWNRLTRQLDITAVMCYVMEQLDKGDTWEMIF